MSIKQAVGEVLARHCNTTAQRWQQVNVEDDLVSISTFWKIELGNLKGKDTIEECTHLDSTMSINQWLGHFEVVVVPTIIQNALPRITVH